MAVSRLSVASFPKDFSERFRFPERKSLLPHSFEKNLRRNFSGTTVPQYYVRRDLCEDPAAPFFRNRPATLCHTVWTCTFVQSATTQCGRTKVQVLDFDNETVFGPAEFNLVTSCDGRLDNGDAKLAEACWRRVLETNDAVILAYGQTGSGKTHSMFGAPKSEVCGLDSAATSAILSALQARCCRGDSVCRLPSLDELFGQMIADPGERPRSSRSSDRGLIFSIAERLFAEQERRALVPTSGNTSSSTAGGAVLRVSFLQLHCERVTTFLEGASIYSLQELETALFAANASRSRRCTGMNQHSSRSHALVVLESLGRRRVVFVDLAGSERLSSTTPALGKAHLAETQSINRSLQSLGRVVTCLAGAEQASTSGRGFLSFGIKAPKFS